MKSRKKPGTDALAAPSVRRRSGRAGNRERIVEAAIELMNERGSLIGTTQVAAHLGISHGNLYYHYSNMHAIVLEVLARLREELRETLAMPPDEVVDAEQLAGYYANGAKVLWRYRFMVSSALELTSGNAELEREYQTFTTAAIDWISRIIVNVVRHHPGPMPANRGDCRKLAENMWVLWNAWPRHAELSRARTRVSPAAIARGLEMIAMTLAPYVEADFHRHVKRSLKRFSDTLKGAGDGAGRMR
jgi:AcrR family transcriptional regulator